MLPTPHPYQGENDLTRMLSLLQAGRAARITSYYPHIGDLQWTLYYPPLGTTGWQHIYLWEDPAANNRLLGWALLDSNGDTCEVYYQPELYGSALAEAMYTWAEEALIPIVRANGQKQIGVFWVIPEDSFHTHWLEARGYRVTNEDAALACSLAEPIPDFRVPEGFQIRTCKGLEEVEARARAQYGAFGNTAPFEQYVERFTHFMQSAGYTSATDVVAAAPDGSIAAFCITWIDLLNRVGLFEPVGTHPDFQHQGLGKAVMLEALRRLLRQGMQQAIVCTAHHNTPALHLYASVGFQPYSVFRWYAKNLD